jgi:hypothetical protein
LHSWNLSFANVWLVITRASWVFFFHEEPEYRNFDAFDFVVSELNARVKADGARNAELERSVVVERALANGIPRNDIEVAITYQVMANLLTEKDGVLRFPNNSGVRELYPAGEYHQHAGMFMALRYS